MYADPWTTHISIVLDYENLLLDYEQRLKKIMHKLWIDMLDYLKCCRKTMNVEDLEKYQTMREKKKVMLEQLNDKGREWRKSNGLVAAGVLEATTLKILGQVH